MNDKERADYYECHESRLELRAGRCGEGDTERAAVEDLLEKELEATNG